MFISVVFTPDTDGTPKPMALKASNARTAGL